MKREKLKYNVHLSINYKSHRKGLVNDISLTFDQRQTQFGTFPDTVDWTKLRAVYYPAASYPGCYPNVWGKGYSQNPRYKNMTIFITNK